MFLFTSFQYVMLSPCFSFVLNTYILYIYIRLDTTGGSNGHVRVPLSEKTSTRFQNADDNIT